MNKTSSKIYLNGGSYNNNFLRKVFQDFTDKCVMEVNSISEWNNKIFHIKDSETGQIKKNLKCNKTLEHWKKNMNINDKKDGEEYLIKKLDDKKKLLEMKESFQKQKKINETKNKNEKEIIEEQLKLIDNLKEELSSKQYDLNQKNELINKKEKELNDLSNELIERKKTSLGELGDILNKYESINLKNENELKEKLNEINILKEGVHKEFENKLQNLKIKVNSIEDIKNNLKKNNEIELNQEKNKLLNEHKNKLYKLDLIEIDLKNTIQNNEDIKKKYEIQFDTFKKNYDSKLDELNLKIKDQEDLKDNLYKIMDNKNQFGGASKTNLQNRIEKEKKIIKYNKKIRKYLLKTHKLNYFKNYINNEIPLLIRNNIDYNYSDLKIMILKFLNDKK